jgi:hypothetical protein
MLRVIRRTSEHVADALRLSGKARLQYHRTLLNKALSEGNLGIAQIKLEKILISEADFLHATQRNDLKWFESVTSLNPRLLHSVDITKNKVLSGAFLNAVKDGNLKIVKYFIDLGLRLSTPQALEVAVRQSHTMMGLYLLEQQKLPVDKLRELAQLAANRRLVCLADAFDKRITALLGKPKYIDKIPAS